MKLALTAVIVGLLTAACVSTGDEDAAKAEFGSQAGCPANATLRSNTGTRTSCF